MKPTTLTPTASYLAPTDVGAGVWISPDTQLRTDRLFHDHADRSGYMLAFKDGSDSAGGTSAFLPSFSEDGVVTFYLDTHAPAELSESIANAVVMDAQVTISLRSNNVLHRESIPMQIEREGDKWTLTSSIPPEQRDAVRAILFDSSPDCSIHIEQSVKVAALMTAEFIKEHWDNDAIQKAVRGRLPGFGAGLDAAGFLGLLDDSGIDYKSLCMVMQALYTTEVQAPALPGYIQHPVNFNNKAYNYYQDNRNPTQIYYLPDSFELGQAPDGFPHASLLEFQTEEGSLDDMRAMFRFYARAKTNSRRIADAKEKLKASLANPKINLVPLDTGNHVEASLSLYLPDEDGLTSSKVAQPDASIDLTQGFSDELHLSFKAFQSLWAAIFTGGPEQVVFTGEVGIQISGGRYGERIGFRGRMSGGEDREQKYFNNLIKEGKDNRYHIKLNVSVFNSIFDDSGVGALTMDFGDAYASGTLEFDTSDVDSANSLIKKSITLQRLVSDIILHKSVPDVFEYVMTVIREEGAPTCCTLETSTGGVYINKSTVDACACKQGDCGCERGKN